MLLAIINIISIASLVKTLREARLSELLEDLRTLDWWWMTLAIISAVTIFLWQAVRWRLVLRPVTAVGFWETARALYVGMFANEVLPLRAGEVIRCYLLARRPDLPLSVALTSLLIERVFDGIWLVAALLVVLPFVSVPPNLRYVVDGAYVLALVILALALVLGVVMFGAGREAATGGSSAPPGKWRRHIHVLIEDLGRIGHSRYLVQAFAASLPHLLLQMLPLYMTLRAYRIDFPLFSVLVLSLMLRLGSAIPQAPANPALPLFLAAVLQNLFSFEAGEAARVGLVLWAVVTLPLIVSGLVSLAVTDVKLGELRKAARNARETEPAGSD